MHKMNHQMPNVNLEPDIVKTAKKLNIIQKQYDYFDRDNFDYNMVKI